MWMLLPFLLPYIVFYPIIWPFEKLAELLGGFAGNIGFDIDRLLNR